MSDAAAHLVAQADQALAAVSDPVPSGDGATAQQTQAALTEAAKARATVPKLATAKRRILQEVSRLLHCCGLHGETGIALIIYLAVTSRLLLRPLSVAVKGPSSAGKSYVVSTVLELFPREAYYALSGMSERALVYSEESLSHRTLVLYEAAGLNGDWAPYLVRSLLSEGRVRYETVEQVKGQMQARLVEREGPTGLILTTTATIIEPELETRMLSATVTDTPEQTQAVLQAIAAQANMVGPTQPDLSQIHALQNWLAGVGPHEVTVPFAPALANLIPPVAVRLRRDFSAVLALVMTHALLHRAQRDTDEHGRIIATLDDYEVVHELVSDLLAEGVQAGVPDRIRKTVNAVTDHHVKQGREMGLAQLATVLGLDKSTASRRAAAAIEAGYLVNLEDRIKQPARYRPVTGMRLPEDRALLPSLEELRAATVIKRAAFE